MAIYLLSDLHINHSNILKYTKRPFKLVEEMNEVIISNYNKVVGFWDTVYFLGDLALNISAEEERSLYSKFNGNKILALGNHDKRSRQFYLDSGFSEVHKSLVIEYKDYKFLLTHIPNHPQWHQKNPNWKPIKVEGDKVVNVHGHTHDTVTNLDPYKYFCVSLEMINYTPISIEEVYNAVNLN